MSEEFTDLVNDVLQAGYSKGYNESLFDVCHVLPHPLGEIIYKVVRYNRKRDPQDLVKIAAWAELEWTNADGNGSQGRSDTGQGRSRTVPQEPGAGVLAALRGDWRSGTSGGRTRPGAKAINKSHGGKRGAETRISTGGGRGKHVGGKSGRGKGKG